MASGKVSLEIPDHVECYLELVRCEHHISYSKLQFTIIYISAFISKLFWYSCTATHISDVDEISVLGSILAESHWIIVASAVAETFFK